MNRRDFTFAAPAAVFFASQIRAAIAQDAARPALPQEAAHAQRMREAAGAFLDSLDPTVRQAATFPLAADQRTQWSNLPTGISPRIGVAIGALPVDSKRRLHDLLRASTSSQGYHKIAAVIRHDDILRADELDYLKDHPPRPRAGRDAVESMGSGSYWAALFGDPKTGVDWAWLLTGHHLGASFTCAGGRLAAMPLFLGSAPVEDITGRYPGEMSLSHEAIRGFDLVRALRPDQAAVAITAREPAFADVLAGVGRRNSLSRYEGIAASALDDAQKRLLAALVEEYVRNADFPASDEQLAAIQAAGLDKLYFSWRGGTDDIRQPFYYRVHGPRLIIEFAVQEPNHIHTIMRDPLNDYGMDWLGHHYEEHLRRG